jgi:hypothetical protein
VRILATPATPMKRKMRSQISVGTCPNSGTTPLFVVDPTAMKLEGHDDAIISLSLSIRGTLSLVVCGPPS